MSAISRSNLVIDTKSDKDLDWKQPGNQSWPELVEQKWPDLSELPHDARLVIQESMKPKGQPAQLAKSFDMSATGPEFPSQIENLSGVLTQALAQEDSLKLQKYIPKEPTINALYQYNYKSTTGNSRAFLGFAPGGGPSDVTPRKQRKTANIAYAGRAGHIPHQYSVPAALGGTQGDTRTEYYMDVMMELLKAEERNFVFGNSLLKDTLGNVVNFDGIYNQLNAARSQNVIDLAGADITLQNLQQYSGRIMDEGNLTSLQNMSVFMPYAARTHFAALTTATSNTPVGARVFYDQSTSEIIGGKSFKGITTADGETLKFITFKWLYEVGSDSASSSNRPTNFWAQASPQVGSDEVQVPVAPSTPAAPTPTGTTGRLATGSYWYSVAAGNESGESWATPTAAILSVTLGQTVPVVCPATTGATYYRIYRHLAAGSGEAVNMTMNGCNQWLAGTIVPGSVGASATFIDTGQNIENTANLLILSQDIQDVVVPQMFELQSYIPPSSKTNEIFYLLHYHTVVLKNFLRCIFIKNAGVSQSGFFG